MRNQSPHKKDTMSRKVRLLKKHKADSQMLYRHSKVKVWRKNIKLLRCLKYPYKTFKTLMKMRLKNNSKEILNSQKIQQLQWFKGHLKIVQQKNRSVIFLLHEISRYKNKVTKSNNQWRMNKLVAIKKNKWAQWIYFKKKCRECFMPYKLMLGISWETLILLNSVKKNLKRKIAILKRKIQRSRKVWEVFFNKYQDFTKVCTLLKQNDQIRTGLTLWVIFHKVILKFPKDLLVLSIRWKR